MALPTMLTHQASSASSASEHKADQASAVQCNKGFQVKGYMSHCVSFKGFLNRQFGELLWKNCMLLLPSKKTLSFKHCLKIILSWTVNVVKVVPDIDFAAIN